MNKDITGKVVSVGKTYIILEKDNIGIIIYAPSPNLFKKDEKTIVYSSEIKGKYTEAVYGFTSVKTRDYFNSQLKIKGVGPKKALDKTKLHIEKSLSKRTNTLNAAREGINKSPSQTQSKAKVQTP